MAEPSPVLIRSQPGIKRDGTRFDGKNYVDGQWCRWQRGLPRKIGGYRAVTSTIPEIARGLSSFSADAVQYLHMGGVSTVTQVRVDSQGVFIGQADRTPVAFASSPDNLWQFEVMQDAAVGSVQRLIAFPGHNLNDISSTVTSDIYTDDVTGTGALVAAGLADPISGGIVVLPPYLFKFGNDGSIAWSVPNKPLDFTSLGSGIAFITAQKIVKALPVRGSSGPSGIFWSLDSVIRVTFDGTDFVFNTVSSESSILSSQAVIEYDGTYYWPGVDRWMFFNGVVQELPNDMNINYFFDGLNFTQRQKVYAFKVPRFGEIWWCYPRGTATECTHAVIYNVREKSWYDTELPMDPDFAGAGSRSVALYPKVYNKPFMVDLSPTGPGQTNYTLWQHETGTDQIIGSRIQAILSSFETAELTMLTGEQPGDSALRISRMESDFVQVGDITIQVRGRANARAPITEGTMITLPDVATGASDQTAMYKDVRRLMSFKFVSNVAGGDYQMGSVVGHIMPADGRITS